MSLSFCLARNGTPIPVVSTETDRRWAIRHILTECRGNFSDLALVNTAHCLGYSVVEIGWSRLERAAADEARAMGRAA